MYGIFYKDGMVQACFLVFSYFFMKSLACLKKSRIFAPHLRNQ